MKPVAFVTPWYGKALKGGAEQQVWQIVNRLVARGHAVEVLTTCCESFLKDWGTNHLPPGKQLEGDVVVRRFRVDRRKGERFNLANEQALSVPHNWLRAGVNPFCIGNDNLFVTENINSGALERYLKKNRKKYHCFVFIPYLYGVVLNGLSLVADQSWLQPCLHNEAYAYLPAVEKIVRSCKGLFFNSEGEKELAIHLYGPGILRKSVVVGEGVEIFEQIDNEEEVSSIENIDLTEMEYVLFLGRRDSTKNTDMLVEAFQKYIRNFPLSRLKLILAGPGELEYGKNIDGVIDFGLVSPAEKNALLKNCAALFQPSKNESFSRVIMEAWNFEKVVCVHGDCLATAIAVRKSEGGLCADSVESWSALFHTIATMDEATRNVYGRNGKNYALHYARWNQVIDRYEDLLGLSETHKQEHSRIERVERGVIHQLLPGFAFGDAISNQALVIRDILRRNGYRSDIYTEHRDPIMVNEALVFSDGEGINSQDGIIYHHSIGTGLTQFVVEHPGEKSLVYHNITPPELVREHDPELAEILENGLKDLGVLARHFPVSVGDSRFNCDDLETNGFTDTEVLPICIAPEKWNMPANPDLMSRFQDGKINILFVGRVISNKCQHDLIDAFAVFKNIHKNSRLLVVGGYRKEEKYFQYLKKKTVEMGLEWDVLFLGKVHDDALHACYRCAHLFWSMSEHEGFGVPLIEAMWFDIPVFAYKSSAVPETMGSGGLLFTDKNDLERLAVTAKLLIEDQDVRKSVVTAQKKRIQAFLPEAFEMKVKRLVQRMYADKMA